VSEIKTSFELDAASKRSLFKAFKDMDQGANQDLKNEVTAISQWMANNIKTAANYAPNSAQSRAVATTARAAKDRLPYIRIGGEKIVTSTGARAGDLLMGSEFGGPAPFANGGKRFFRRSARWYPKGNAGYWIFPTLRRNHDTLTDKWHSAIERYVENPWGRNG
jgi:hypothetical protein